MRAARWWRQEAGGRDLLRMALPLIISNSFLTLQITIDRILLSRSSSDAVAAAMPAVFLYWTPLAFLQNIAGYAATFVAQYTGAGRPNRVGPIIWQALYFAVAAGLGFLTLLPLAPAVIALGGHSPAVQSLELTYFRCLAFAALPTILVAAANSFFAGRGDTWTVLFNDAVGMSMNAALAYALVFGAWGMPNLGIAGAGWATVVGSTTTAALALVQFLRPRYRAEFHTLIGWRFDPDLFRRLMRFGVPNGLLWMLDALAFTVFLFLVGRLGDVELAATSIAFSINMLAIVPMLGMGQAVSVLVGQNLGRNRPDLAARSTWTGFWLAGAYIMSMAILYVATPSMFVALFRGDDVVKAAQVAALVPVLLRYVAIYSLCDSLNVVFSFALRGAGDTRFVSAAVLVLAWPVMVLPTWAAWRFGWGLYWAWGFGSAYIMLLGLVFLARFLTGHWKTMRVIEVAMPDPAADPCPGAMVG